MHDYYLREAKNLCIIAMLAGPLIALGGMAFWDHEYVICGGVMLVVGACFYGMLTRAEESEDVR